MNATLEISQDLLKDLQLDNHDFFPALNTVAESESKYIKDLRVNLKNALTSDFLSDKETRLIALAVAVNQNNTTLTNSFKKLAKETGATDEEIAEIYACDSLLATNNVFYRFRHFTKKDYYNNTSPKIKMTIMMSPVLGKEFFELVSLAISAVNGCEMCINSHEGSLLQLGSNEQRIFDAVRIAAVVTGLSKLIF